MPQGEGTYGSKVGRPPKKKMGGGMLQKKPVAMKKGGEVKKMRDGGMCRGMGAATKGGRYKI